MRGVLSLEGLDLRTRGCVCAEFATEEAQTRPAQQCKSALDQQGAVNLNRAPNSGEATLARGR